MIKIKIVENDSSAVAKVVIVDGESRVLFLKRSNYVDKYAGDWDLPGGHLKPSEDILSGLSREVEEETGISIESPEYLTKIENLDFFYCNYNSQPIKLSHEHTDYKFFKKSELDPEEKFQKVAIMALEKINDKY